MYVNRDLLVVLDQDEYLSSDGILYPKFFPKDRVADLYKVVESEQPVLLSTSIITGYRIEVDSTDPENIIYRQVWEYVDKTAEEYNPELLIVKEKKKLEFDITYWGFVTSDIEFTTIAGSTKIYQASDKSIFNIQAMLDTYKTETPEGFYWVTKDNYREKPFTRADLERFAFTVGDRGHSYFQHNQDLKVSVDSKLTIEEVNEVVW